MEHVCIHSKYTFIGVKQAKSLTKKKSFSAEKC